MKKRLIKYGIRLIAFVVVIAIITMVIKSVQTNGHAFGEKGIINYTKGLEQLSVCEMPVLENEHCALYIDENYSIRLLNKLTGKIWSSTLSDEAQNCFNVPSDTALSSCEIAYLSNENTITPYMSYTESVKRSQSRLYKAKNGIRMTFIFGERKSDDITPKALTESRFNQLLSKLDKEGQEFLKRRYERFSIDTMSEADNPKEKIATFSSLKKTPLYIVSDTNGKVIISKTKELFSQLGYTRDDYVKDNKLTGYSVDTSECVFKVSYDLKLDGKDLVVTIPVSELSFYNNYPILSVSPLKFFTSSYSESGEIVVPFGSGSVMKFGTNNTKMSFESRFYGKDSSDSYEEMPAQMSGSNENSITMPVYFFTEGNDTVMTVIESGAEAGKLHIEKDSSSTYVYTSFDIIQNGYSYLTDKKKTLIYGSDSISSDIVIRYRCMESGGYVNDANEYKDYLIKKGLLTKNDLSENPLFLLETTGTVENKSGGTTTLTTAENIESMLLKLSEDKKTRVSIKMLGMNNGGLQKQMPGVFKYNSKVMNSKDFKNITEIAEKMGGKAYLQLNHLYYYNHSLFDRYSLSRYNAKKIDKSWAIIGKYDPVEGTYSDADPETWVLTPQTYLKTVEEYLNQGFKSVGVGNFATDINSDYNYKNYFDRTKTLKKVILSLKNYKNANTYVAAKNANSYAFAYVNLIEEMPDSGSNATIFDNSVPFCQIVLHGNIEYTSQVINYSADPENAVLKAIEYGSGLHFCLNQNINFNLFKTKYAALYSTSFEENKDFVASSEEKISQALNGLNNKAIVSHSKINNVSKTTYSGGTVIYVNFNEKAVVYDGMNIPAKGFIRK